jgi:hypothetical protein
MKLVFDFAAQQIGIEGDGPELLKLLQAARELAPELSHIQIATRGPGSARQASTAAVEQKIAGRNGHSDLVGQTMRQFVRSLPLDNAAERIAAIAYYVKTQEGRESFAPKEMSEWFTHCGLQKPAQMPVAIFDAKRKYGYLESGGHGKWRLTTGGENLVVGKQNQIEERQEDEA